MTRFAAIILILGMLLGALGWRGQFLWDDMDQIVRNEMVHSLNNLPLLFTSGTFYNQNEQTAPPGSFYRPLLSFTYAWIYSFFGNTPLFFHIFQTFLFSLNAVLIFFIFRNWLSTKTAFTLAVLFLVHPMNVEAVAYIAAINDTACVFLGLVALLWVLKDKDTWWKWLGVWGWLVLSILYKETGAIFWVIIGIYIWLFKRKEILRFGYYGAYGGFGYGLLRWGWGKSISLSTSTHVFNSLPLGSRLMSLPKIWWFYISTYFFPKTLLTGQKWWVKEFSFADFWWPILCLILFGGILILLIYKIWQNDKGKGKVALWSASILLIGLLVHSQIVALDFMVVEKWFYIPQIGLLLIGGLAWETKNVKINKKITTGLAILIVGGLIFRFGERIKDWQSGIDLFEHDIRVGPDNGYLESLLGLEYQMRGQKEAALACYQKADKLYLSDNPPWYNMAVIYEQLGNLTEAEKYYLKSRQIPKLPEGAWESIIVSSLNNHEWKTALESAQKAVEKNSTSARLNMLYAITLYKNRQINTAISTCQKALTIKYSDDGESICQKIINGEEVAF